MTTSLKKALVQIAALFVVFTLCVFLFLRSIMQGAEAERRETHQAWQRLHPETPMSFEDWQRLKNAYLLPGQQRPR